ncbi:hypothetical protein C8R47DRAFT_1086711 [Mycena vitilis]|nr:hypothetical protein C8R47DRAFT_1086711 [Mycena vitilis]
MSYRICTLMSTGGKKLPGTTLATVLLRLNVVHGAPSSTPAASRSSKCFAVARLNSSPRSSSMRVVNKLVAASDMIRGGTSLATTTGLKINLRLVSMMLCTNGHSKPGAKCSRVPDWQGRMDRYVSGRG